MEDAESQLKQSTQVNALFLSVFRFLFGILMIPQVLSITPSIHELEKSTFVFHYPYLHFIEAYSHELIYFLTVLSIIGAILIALGVALRWGSLLFLLSFGYLFLIDMSFYNNHYYLWCLISFLFIFLPSRSTISIFDVIKKRTDKTISVAYHTPFALLISIVYFYGGIAKINADWLQGYPMRLLNIFNNSDYADFLGIFISYAGLLFDLLIGFFLWKKPKAWYVIIPYFVFHISNYFLFNIGEFPIVMMAAILIYIPISRFTISELKNVYQSTFSKVNRFIFTLFFSIQLVFPMRFLLMDGNVAWDREGHYFSWRMMLNNHTTIYFQYLITIPDKNIKYWVDFSQLLTKRQLSNTFHDPYFIWQLARKLEKDAVTKYTVSSDNVFVYCKSIVQLNQHNPKPLIDQTVDLTTIEYRFLSTNAFVSKF